MAGRENAGDVIASTTVPASTLTPGGGGIAPAPAYSIEDYKIEIAPAAAADDAPFVARLARIVNEVYVETEVGIWRDGYQRTSAAEVAELIRAGELAVAYLANGNGNSSSISNKSDTNNDEDNNTLRIQPQPQPVGCVCIKRLPCGGDSDGGGSGKMGEFGMLSLDGMHRGGGLGRAMVRFAEDRCRGWGLTTVELELLFPTAFEHAFKARLSRWYARMGYEEVCLRPFANDFPRLAPLLAGPCEYRIFEKRLV
ncbi:hypothetical protein DL762_001569 [Monosporascus cannonballus]|uniref:N-acetyltransferase domain-containing protein n=1 Tax=Monosporascus cannonballus TaxID=155416 RepID=A0ABY0HKA0_9PEZI|nr:hypothetical protein DL762_001569 [Monosporascus cannonballus]